VVSAENLILPGPRLFRPDGQSEHPDEMSDAGRSLFFKEVDDDLAVGPGGEPMAFSLQLLSEGGKIVNLPVKDQPDRPVLVGHRLPTGLRQIDNAQPPVAGAATDVALMAEIDVEIVRPPMSQEIRHPSQESFIDRRPGKIKFSADAAHDLSLPHAVHPFRQTVKQAVQLVPANVLPGSFILEK